MTAIVRILGVPDIDQFACYPFERERMSSVSGPLRFRCRSTFLMRV